MTAYAVQRRQQGLCPGCQAALAASPLSDRLNQSSAAVAQAKLAADLSGRSGAVQREAVDHDEETLAIQQKAVVQKVAEDEDSQV